MVDATMLASLSAGVWYSFVLRGLGGVRARAGTEVIVDLRARVDLMKPAKLSEEDL